MGLRARCHVGIAIGLRRMRGLTLIELAIGLSVLAILGTLAVPSISAQLDRQRLHTAAQTLAADLSEARFEAARRGQVLHLQASGGAAWCWAISAQPDCPCGTAHSCQIRNVRAADHPGVQLSAGVPVLLDPVGSGAPAEVATLQTKRGERLRVEVAALGRPRVCVAGGQWAKLPPC